MTDLQQKKPLNLNRQKVDFTLKTRDFYNDMGKIFFDNCPI